MGMYLLNVGVDVTVTTDLKTVKLQPIRVIWKSKET